MRAGYRQVHERRRVAVDFHFDAVHHLEPWRIPRPNLIERRGRRTRQVLDDEPRSATAASTRRSAALRAVQRHLRIASIDLDDADFAIDQRGVGLDAIDERCSP